MAASQCSQQNTFKHFLALVLNGGSCILGDQVYHLSPTSLNFNSLLWRPRGQGMLSPKSGSGFTPGSWVLFPDGTRNLFVCLLKDRKMIWQVGLALLVLFLVWKYIIDSDPLDQLPGPTRLPYIGSVLTFFGVKYNDLFPLMQSFPKKYGYRYMIKVFGRRILHVYNVEDVEIVLSHTKNISKSKPYTFLQPWLGTGLLLSTGGKWHRRRKILTPTFHFSILRNFSKIFEEKSRDLVKRLKEMPTEQYLDVLAVISEFTLYTICETAMGTRLDTDKSKAAVEYKESIKIIGNQVIIRLTRFWLHMDFVFYRTSLGGQFVKCLEVVRSFADNVIKERRKQVANPGRGFDDKLDSKKRQALLDLLLEAESKGEIDVDGIREEVNTFMFEGHDTTAMALAFGLMLLADHEEIQEKIHEECKGIFGESDRTPSWADLAEMKYLDATIKEILRLYPSVPFIGRVVTEDFMLGDLEVRKGAELLVHIYELHRRPDLFPDPDEFRPERFLGGVAFLYLTSCLYVGQRFAMQEMKCALSEICRHFRLFPKSRGARPALKADIILRPVDPMYVKFVPR
ncbi:unnamed protein product, partial [Iphiclides podalirius]